MGSFVFKELGAATFGPPVWNNDVKSPGYLQKWTSFTPVRQDHSFKAGSQVPQVVNKKYPPANAGAVGSIPGLGRSPGVRNGNPLQYSCLENSMDRGTWWATVYGVTKRQTQLSP